MEAHMLKLQDEFSQQKHPSQGGGDPECNDQPLQRKSISYAYPFTSMRGPLQEGLEKECHVHAREKGFVLQVARDNGMRPPSSLQTGCMPQCL